MIELICHVALTMFTQWLWDMPRWTFPIVIFIIRSELKFEYHYRWRVKWMFWTGNQPAWLNVLTWCGFQREKKVGEL